MCGIAGFVDFKKTTTHSTIEKMVKSMHHRGPDDEGLEIFHTSSADIGLAQTRLSIIDLSQLGHQPMHYKHLSVVFNGEIYNYKEIKNELEKLGHSFLTTSDTEVLIHALYEWGNKAVDKFIGMYSYCLYDRDRETVTITRDRSGVKPLYYYYKNGLFLFGSELKALMAHPGFEKDIEISVLPLYLQYGYIPAPYSIFKNCYKLNPGHHLTFNISSGELASIQYWDASSYYKKPKLNISYIEAKEEIHKLLKSACNYRMVADVPVGVFLSGGYDSTAVTAILQGHRTEKIKTFTIGFEEGNNEAPFAKETALFLGTDHTEYYCTTKQAQEIIPNLPFYFDEPFGDSSAIPTTLVSQLARQQVTVALSADGGDEVFCGYHSYSNLNKYQRLLDWIPNFLKPYARDTGFFLIKVLPFLHESAKHKLDTFCKAIHPDQFLQAAVLFQQMNEKPVNYINNFFKKNIIAKSSPFQIEPHGFQHPLDIAMAIDYRVYLQNDILTKVDRATMSVSLEGREPLVDHRLFEFSAQLPFDFKYNGTTGKRILKDIVHDYIPKEMMDRPKTGFSLPINQWLRKDLSFLIEEYLSQEALKSSGIFNEKFIAGEIQRFKDMKMHYTSIIWYLLMFQMWFRKWIND
ncbi:asparagine synthase [Schleiferia thermophila str. Yellowstone]|jgi:asparagine synthase (glutamine-hydrolysing)|uniref:asparagine synthase (glutamine-hydrolyzing) n=1 Tax=Schleiferia thermophila TaxID=884107 RepID=UPI0004E6EEBD|nr:asparagine synthase (glutamine-hydrolyzing) [Schleiferia thermophila]KFD40149.1 asparagine synthase [Schleiferia thermophila str. Yellowstone]